VNDAAVAYKGAIPQDRWKVPHMPREELAAEIEDCVRFWAIENDSGDLIGVMGIQDVGDVNLIRHARVLTAWQERGIGGRLLARLLALADPERPIPASTEASADRTVGYLVVLADGRRIPGLQGLRRRRGVLCSINKTC
jgi:GNAT superfamily N-acetyltransferase